MPDSSAGAFEPAAVMFHKLNSSDTKRFERDSCMHRCYQPLTSANSGVVCILMHVVSSGAAGLRAAASAVSCALLSRAQCCSCSRQAAQVQGLRPHAG